MNSRRYLWSFANHFSHTRPPNELRPGMSFVIAIIGYLGYRFLTRGERGSRIEALTTIAGSEG